MKSRIFSRTVLLLALISLFTDISSEMLYPVLPIYLQSIGFSVLWIGILEGIAQVLIGLSTGYFGRWSDLLGRRMPFVTGGYLLSTLAKPLMGMFSNLALVFTARVGERLGKGIRTGARDALLADESEEKHKAKVFGFHRGMDTLGAAIGPLLALLYLSFYPGNYKPLFLIAFLPGLIGVILTLRIREKQRFTPTQKVRPRFFDYLAYWKNSSPGFRKLMRGFLLFGLFNSSDAFLFLMIRNQGISDQNLILAYVLYNLVYAILAYPAGILADRFGMKKVLLTGLCFFSLCYYGFSVLDSGILLFLCFTLYGVFGACFEGVSKAWLSLNCDPKDRGTALGFYKSFSGIMVLPASLLTGLLWEQINPAFALLISAFGGLLAIFYFLSYSPAEKGH